MRYLHTMVRVRNIEQSLAFYCGILGLEEVNRMQFEKGRYTLIFLKAPADTLVDNGRKSPLIELTFNWDDEVYQGGRSFGHLAFEVDNIYEITGKLRDSGVTISRPPRDGKTTFVRSPDGISIELLQKGTPLPAAEPWASMPNSGTW